MQSYLVKIFTEDELKDLLNELFLDDTVDLLEDSRQTLSQGSWKMWTVRSATVSTSC